MNKTFFIAIIAGLVVGGLAGILIFTVPKLDEMIPDRFKTMVIGGIGGGIAAIVITKNSQT